jgi:hypothetical protein
MAEGPANPQEQQPPIIVNVSVARPTQQYTPPTVQSGAELRAVGGCGCGCGASNGSGAGV